jgi:putative transposase
VRKTFEYRLYPTRRQRELLMACLTESRRLYNEMLETVKDHYAESGDFLFKNELAGRFKGRGGECVPATTVQTLADRLDKALRRYVARKKRKERVGFPRFKSPNRWHSITLRQWGKDVGFEQGRLRVPKKLGKSIKIKQHRSLEGAPKTACLKFEADGKWYALIVCDLGDEPPERIEGTAVGLDVGIKVFVADSEGNTVENPRYYRRSQKKLRSAQRRTCRRKKGSKRRRKAARAVAKRHLKIARQRKNFLHKTARRYVEAYETIVVEDLNVAGMVKNRHLAKSIADASWSKFIKILEQKAESAGARVVKVSAHFTTQQCSECPQLVPKSLSVRTHTCIHCGHTQDRDVNAAKNILRAWTGPSERNVGGRAERAPRSRLPKGGGVVTGFKGADLAWR